MQNDFCADVLLHFGMHGALEFMPGRQSGLNHDDWPDRLIGDVPNVYLYAANNPSEATLAKRRANAVTVTHLTPPLAAAGLYKGLVDLKDSLDRWRAMAADDPARGDLEALIADQAEAVNLDGAPEDLWTKLRETEEALIPSGLPCPRRQDGRRGRGAIISAQFRMQMRTPARQRRNASGPTRKWTA